MRTRYKVTYRKPGRKQSRHITVGFRAAQLIGILRRGAKSRVQMANDCTPCALNAPSMISQLIRKGLPIKKTKKTGYDVNGNSTWWLTYSVNAQVLSISEEKKGRSRKP